MAPPLTAAMAVERAIRRYLARPLESWHFPPQELLGDYSLAELAWFRCSIR